MRRDAGYVLRVMGCGQKAHSSTSYFKELFAALKPMLDGAPEIEMYDELARLRE